MTGWPEGEHLTIGLWFDRPMAPSALVAVGDVLEAEGGQYGGQMATGPAGVTFSSWHDLAGIEWSSGWSVEQMRQAMLEGTAYRVNMDLPGLGPAMLDLEGTPESAPPAQHPVALAVGADVLALDQDSWDDEARAIAVVLQPQVLRYLSALCTRLDPAYAMLYTEGETGTCTPTMLASGEGTLEGDFFVSRRFAVNSALSEQLAEVARVTGATLEWDTGTFFSGTGYVLPDAPDWDALENTFTPVAQTLGQLLTAGEATHS